MTQVEIEGIASALEDVIAQNHKKNVDTVIGAATLVVLGGCVYYLGKRTYRDVRRAIRRRNKKNR
jgi:hypothetical protein